MAASAFGAKHVGIALQQCPNLSIDELLEIPNVDAQQLFVEASRANLVDRMEEIFNNYDVDVNGVSESALGTPLTAACDANSTQATKWLLSQPGIDPNKDQGDLTALWAAAEHGNVRNGSLLLQAGAKPNTIKKSSGYSAVSIAAQNGHKAMLALLLSNDADPNMFERCTTSGNSGQAPVLIATATVRVDVVAQLVNAGASISAHLDLLKRIVAQTRLTGQTTVVGAARNVENKELDVLQKLLDDTKVCNLMANPIYAKARTAEKQRNYKDALKLLQSVPLNIAAEQLQLDIERNIEFVYGMKGSDGRVSVWNHMPLTKEVQPEPLQFRAWVRVGRKLFMHGGYNFMDKDLSKRKPLLDEVWELDLDSRKWTLLTTTGKSPGPRSGHDMFAYKNSLYIWGGTGPAGAADTKLYRMDLSMSSKCTTNSYTWEQIKTKGFRPPPREEFAGVIYRGKYYISGGNVGTLVRTDDLWCLNMSSLKWSVLKSGPKKRANHRMFAARGKIFTLGGRNFAENTQNIHLTDHSIDDFDAYDIEKKSWSRVPIYGDKPYDISEYCILPIFCKEPDDNDEEPTSIIVWGGYSAVDTTRGDPTTKEREAKYGQEANDFAIPYRKRLLRYDIDLNVWTLLDPTFQVHPKAEAYAAELETNNGQTMLLIGGGYGFTDKTAFSKGTFASEDVR